MKRRACWTFSFTINRETPRPERHDKNDRDACDDSLRCSARRDAPAVEQIERPLQLKDMIGADLLDVADWVKRRQGVANADALLTDTWAILAAIDKPPVRTP